MHAVRAGLHSIGTSLRLSFTRRLNCMGGIRMPAHRIFLCLCSSTLILAQWVVGEAKPLLEVVPLTTEGFSVNNTQQEEVHTGWTEVSLLPAPLSHLQGNLQ